jgi:hypothetical protein
MENNNNELNIIQKEDLINLSLKNKIQLLTRVEYKCMGHPMVGLL